MATLSTIAKGTRARKAIPFPLSNARPDPKNVSGWIGDTIMVDVRPLSSHEEVEILQSARAWAKDHGEIDPKDGEPLYDYAVQLFTVAAGTVDHDSAENDPKPFCDGGVPGILKRDDLTREHIAYLHAWVRQWHDECSPRALQLNAEQYLETVSETASGNMLPFLRLRPGTQWLLFRSTACLALPLLERSSSSGAHSSGSTAS